MGPPLKFFGAPGLNSSPSGIPGPPDSPSFLLTLLLAFIAREYNADLSTEVRNLQDELLIDISAALNKAIARNFRTSMKGNLPDSPPIHTLFPAPVTTMSPHLLLHMQALPLTSTRHNSIPIRVFSPFQTGHILASLCRTR